MIKDRNGHILPDDSQNKTLSFLYNNALGRIICRVLVKKWVSELGRAYMESRFSKCRIKRLIKQHSIDMTDYEQRDFLSFNDFFTRKLADGKRSIDTDACAVISPADSKLTVYDITCDGRYSIKDCEYSIYTLLGGDKLLADEYIGGKCFVYRLTVDNYHRYCYTDSGIELEHRFIPGIYHTVNPIATEKLDVYGKNCRELTVLDTDNFGRVAYIEVGAMMVGRINNSHPTERFKRGDEKGYFSFGGSTIVMLYKKDAVTADGDITENSKNAVETVVRYGERVGVKGV